MSKEKVIFLVGLVVAIVVAQVIYKVVDRKTPLNKI
jgi:hypothetical protein